MVPSSAIPWYNRPASEFPARRWLRQRYPFTVSPQVFARPARKPTIQRRFPALVWLEQQRPLRQGLEQLSPESISWPQHHLSNTRREG
jgi:hypothetical protein